MVIMFILGAGVSYYKLRVKSAWSEDGIQALREGCSLLGQSSDFCECYINEVTSNISMQDFWDLNQNISRSEIDKKKAQDFIDPIMAKCSEPE